MLWPFLKNTNFLTRSASRVFPSGGKLADSVPSLATSCNKLSNRNVRSFSSQDNDFPRMQDNIPLPAECDILIIGGGAMGSSTAYWLKEKVYKNMKVVVVEKDSTYTKASTALSVGGLRQQFSLRENIEMSLYGADFIRRIDYHLGIEGEPPVDVNFNPYGYLVMASDNGAENLQKNSALQNSLGAKNVLLTPSQLKLTFPWISTDGIALACLGLEKEGWFDPWSVLCAFKKKAIYLGAQYVDGEVKKFGQVSDSRYISADGYGRLNSVTIETPAGEEHEIKFAVAVIAAGANSGNVAKLAGVGTGPDIRGIPLPVEPRKRYVYCFHCPEGPGINTPLTIDPSGAYFRRDGLAGTYIGGCSPKPNEEPSVEDLSVDHEFFTEKVWPRLAHRVKAFENLKVKSSWAGYYEYNTFDKNGIIGVHPYFHNLYFATGFSGHGIQQAPAVGRAISELILDSMFKTIDLHNLGFERFIEDKPMLEANVV